MRTDTFVCTVCCFADGTPRSSAQRFPTKEPYGCGVPLAGACPTIRLPHPRRRARPLGAPVQALPILYKPVRLHCLPLRGRWTYVSALQPPDGPAFCEKILQDAKKGLTSAQRYDILSEQSKSTYARVVELADSLDSGSSVHSGRAGSTPASRTTKNPTFVG